MNRKESFAGKARKFMDGKGFYVVVVLCVAAIGISGWYLVEFIGQETGQVVDSVTATAPVETGSIPELSQRMEEPVSAGADLTEPVTIQTQEEVPEVEPEQTVSPEDTSPVIEERQTVAPLVYTWPVKGEIVTAHSMDTLIYDTTMGDWRVHNGMDIAAELGTNVMAVAAGTVASIEQDDLMGTMVVIDHGQGMVSTYANLQSVPVVSVGDSVLTGSIIGAVGATAIREGDLVNHLHFEMTKDGCEVDPVEFLPQTQ